MPLAPGLRRLSFEGTFSCKDIARCKVDAACSRLPCLRSICASTPRSCGDLGVFRSGALEQGERTADMRFGLAIAFQVGVDFSEPLQSRRRSTLDQAPPPAPLRRVSFSGAARPNAVGGSSDRRWRACRASRAHLHVVDPELSSRIAKTLQIDRLGIIESSTGRNKCRARLSRAAACSKLASPNRALLSAT